MLPFPPYSFTSPRENDCLRPQHLYTFQYLLCSQYPEGISSVALPLGVSSSSGPPALYTHCSESLVFGILSCNNIEGVDYVRIYALSLLLLLMVERLRIDSGSHLYFRTIYKSRPFYFQ